MRSCTLCLPIKMILLFEKNINSISSNCSSSSYSEGHEIIYESNNNIDNHNKEIAMSLSANNILLISSSKAIITEAEILIKKLEHMYLLSKAIANLNQKTIDEIISFVLWWKTCTHLIHTL